MVAKIRRNFCQYRMWTRMCSSTGVPMSDHHGRKDSKHFEAISVSYDALGKTGIEGSQGERHCLEWSLEDVDETVVADLYLLGSVGTGCEISKLSKGVLA